MTEESFTRQALRSCNLHALRLALLHATRDPALAAMTLELVPIRSGAAFEMTIAEEFHEDLFRRAERFLATEADGYVPRALDERGLREMMELALGHELTDAEFAVARTMPAIDEFPLFADWTGARPQRADHFSVAIIGAGLCGIAMGVQLEQLGIPYVIYERRPDAGGTWAINTYPDARVDTASTTYEYSFVKNHPWSEQFARQPEVRAYLEMVAAKYGVLEHIRFETELTAAEFDEESSSWRLRVRDAHGVVTSVRSNFIVTATGLFSTPRQLAAEGIDSFTGDVIHTTEWTERHTARDKRVAIIGNGSTGVQLLARIAEVADHVHVFQRTPQWIAPREGYGEPVSPEMRWVLDNIPHYWNWARTTALKPNNPRDTIAPDPEWQSAGGIFSRSNDRLRENLTGYIKTQVDNRPDLVEKLVPDYTPAARRPIVDNGWYRSLTRDNVELVTDPIDRFTADAIVTSDGTERAVDLVLTAVGFEVTKWLWPIDFCGVGGRHIEERWNRPGGPRAFQGLAIPEFPNLFVLYGPNAQPATGGGIGVGGLPAWMETWVGYIARVIVAVVEDGHLCAEVTDEAFWEYNNAVDDEASKLIWLDPAANPERNYYVNEHGRLGTSTPLSGLELGTRFLHLDRGHFRFSGVPQGASDRPEDRGATRGRGHRPHAIHHPPTRESTPNMIDLGLEGARAVVVGAGFIPMRAGHGRGCALQLARAGARVACIDKDAGRAEEIVREIVEHGGDAFPIVADVLDPEQARAAIDEASRRMDGIDVCVDIVGQAHWNKAADIPDTEWDSQILVNLTQVFYVFRATIPHLLRNARGGSLVALTSVDGIGSSRFHAGYGAAKAGLISLVKTMADEYGRHGVRVNAVAPGNVGGGNWDLPEIGFGEDVVNALAPPRGRDVADAVLFLASGLATKITGQTLVVDGGALIQSPWRMTEDQIGRNAAFSNATTQS
ncbi:SDR family oxidoreductase [Gordonia sp. CPCC 206044]|uniref:SDR family oxidoreductase n=1 Tax=Gordonia sp. CPCC 206044 TaxID=3140793 RepID=UPI003AF3D644